MLLFAAGLIIGSLFGMALMAILASGSKEDVMRGNTY
jgi:uncharacterized oligopeptide transporter (OPT) family protein